MSTSWRLPVFTKPKFSSQVRNVNLGCGFRTIAVLSVIFGQFFNYPLIEIQTFSLKFFILRLYTFCLNILLVLFSIISSYCMMYNVTEFSKAAYFAAGFLGVIEITLRIIFLNLKKDKIENLFIDIKKIIIYSDFKLSQKSILFRISRLVIIVISILLSIYLSALIVNFIAVKSELSNSTHYMENGTNSKYFLNDISIEIINLCSKGESIEQSTISCSMFVVYLLSFLGVGKVVVSDVLFYACYWLVIEELGLLSRGLHGTISYCKIAKDHSQLESWLQFHHSVSRILRDLNDITTPAITVAVVFSTLQMCLVAFVIVKQYLEPSDALSIILFGIMSLHQLVMYCILGQRIREKVADLQSASFSAPWLGSRRGTQNAVLMICSATTERSMQLPGAPFFALSLDFFASIMGAVFTYFIVLIQVNK